MTKITTKAEAIRKVTKDDISISNVEIKQRVKNLFGLDVQTNHIIELVGPYCRRKHQGEAGKILMKEAEKYVKTVGSRRLAVQLVNSVAGL